MRWSGRRVVDYLVLAGLIAAVVVASRYVDGFKSDGGPVVVVDGDSLRLDGRNVRLHGIDAPELHQSCQQANGNSYSCGRDAKAYLHKLIAGRNVDCTLVDVDRYDRDVAVCKAGDINLNSAIVSGGWALAYRRHSLNYIKAERQARQRQKGIWRGKFENPQDWRARNRR